VRGNYFSEKEEKMFKFNEGAESARFFLKKFGEFSGKVEICFRPRGIKFDEGDIPPKLDLTECNGIKVGSNYSVDLWKSKYDLNTSLRESYVSREHTILAFFELTGHIKGTRARIKDMFCATAYKDRYKTDLPENWEINHSRIPDKPDKIYLFPIDVFVKT
jgi:hypothetical protein